MSTLRVNTITDTSGTSANLYLPGVARAWVNFNGTGTVAIRASLNVSSITDNGTGDYTVNFTNALVDANYAANVSTVPPGPDPSYLPSLTSLATGSVRFTVSKYAAGVGDPPTACVAVFR
jgi:hypothetical protein